MMEFLLISSMCAQRDPLYALADSCGGDASDDLQQLNPLGKINQLRLSAVPSRLILQ
jgi:hypothetical protein